MKILLAVDGSKHASAAIEKCCELISIKDGSEIRIISVADVTVPPGTEPFGVTSDFNVTINNELKKLADTYAADAEETVREKLGDGVNIESCVFRGSPKIKIVEEAESWGADLIVIGSHGYGFFERLLLGSVSTAVLHHAPCSVLVVKMGEDSDE